MIAVFEKPEIRKHAMPLTLHQYHTLVNQGAITNDVEFIEGALIEKMPKSPLHEYIIAKLMGVLSASLNQNFWLRKEGPISTEDSEPEPDISIVKGRPEDFITKHPSSAEFIAEVCITSHDIDFAKADIYADAGVPVYAIFDVMARIVHLYTEPQNGKYREIRRLADIISVESLSLKIDLKSIFP